MNNNKTVTSKSFEYKVALIVGTRDDDNTSDAKVVLSFR